MSSAPTLTDPLPRVLVKEKIADAGVDLLRDEFEVELGLDWDQEELERRIGEFEAILIRSATKMTADLIARADRLKVIGRAGTGVDNVDMGAATKRGIIVANAPESNSIAAAEHTLALALALCRNVPQAHSSLVAGEWARSRYGGSELYGKTLGVVGFGRIGQLVAKRAQAFDMDVVAFDMFVTPERFRELGVEGAETLSELYAPRRPDHAARAQDPRDRGHDRRRGDRSDARGNAAGQLRPRRRWSTSTRSSAGSSRARLAGVALDVFPEEPFTEHPLFERDDVVLTPHLGSLDRRGPGPGRSRHRRPGARRAHRRRGHQRGQHRRGAPGGDGSAGAVRAAVREARPPRPGPGLRRRRPGRGRLPRPDRRARHPPARDRGAGRDPLRPHRGAGQPRQRSGDGRGPRDRVDRAQGVGLGGLHRAGHGPDRRRSRSPGPGLGRATSPTSSASGARASTCRSPTTWRSSATPTSRG